MTLLASLREFFKEQGGTDRTYLVAYSGGMDSHVLLSLCAELRHEFSLKLKAIHLNHGISPFAAAWSEHCQAVCEKLQIEFVAHELNLSVETGESLEEKARDERYHIFASALNQGDMLLTAHHEDDQAETMLIQLLRGAGPKGLSAMPAIKAFAVGHHARPLLHVSRSSLHDYANEKKLTWIEDESNQNAKFTRNFIRHEVIPILQSRWPNVSAAIARSANYCAETQHIAEMYAAELTAQVTGSRPHLLSVAKLLLLDEVRQRLALRSWINTQGFDLPDTRKIQTIIHDVLSARWDSMPCVNWGSVVLRRYRDDLYLLPVSDDVAPDTQYLWDLESELNIPAIGTLVAQTAMGRGISPKVQEVRVVFRSSLDSETYAHRLKNLYQSYGVPPWERGKVPILLIDDVIIAMTGYYLDSQYIAKPQEYGKTIHIT